LVHRRTIVLLLRGRATRVVVVLIEQRMARRRTLVVTIVGRWTWWSPVRRTTTCTCTTCHCSSGNGVKGDFERFWQKGKSAIARLRHSDNEVQNLINCPNFTRNRALAPLPCWNYCPNDAFMMLKGVVEDLQRGRALTLLCLHSAQLQDRRTADSIYTPSSAIN
jgi:hypothetical protein